MFCIKCGASFPRGTNFCPKCGQTIGQVANVVVNSASAAVKTKSNPLWTFIFLILIVLVVISFSTALTVSDLMRFDFIISMAIVFETLVVFFVLATIIFLLFIVLKKYVLPKLWHRSAKQHKSLSTLSRKFFRRK